jgi:phosphoglycolate phosphatase
MDGTLSNTALATVGSCAEVARRYGLEAPGEQVIKAAMGWPSPGFWRLLWPELSDKLLAELDPIAEDLESQAIERIGAGILFPGVRDMLHALRDVGCTLYIASTGSPSHVSVTLNAAGITPLFDKICCGEPDKIDMVGCILSGISRAGALMAGDMKKDADAARGNGILAAGAGWGYVKPDERALFDHILETPDELVRFVR